MKIGTIELYWASVEELDATGVSSNLQGLRASLGNLIDEYCDDDISGLKVEIQLLTLNGGTGFNTDGWGYTFEQVSTKEVVYYDTIHSVLEKLNRDIDERFQERR
jgi:hypothetical protein